MEYYVLKNVKLRNVIILTTNFSVIITLRKVELINLLAFHSFQVHIFELITLNEFI